MAWIRPSPVSSPRSGRKLPPHNLHGNDRGSGYGGLRSVCYPPRDANKTASRRRADLQRSSARILLAPSPVPRLGARLMTAGANTTTATSATLELLTVAEAATALRVSQRTVRRLIDADEIRICRIGRAVRIAGDELRRYVAKSLR